MEEAYPMTPEEWNELESASKPGEAQRGSSPGRLLERLDTTEKEEEHPAKYNGPCFCRLCMSYADL
jgi:hypothetical protein